jgi:DNA-binding protein H-NS
MKFGDLEKMPLDQLWRLHESIIAILDRKLVDETSKLQHKLDELGRKFGKTPSDIPQRRPYPKVEPKFRNPADPSQTWSGRGKQPRWISKLLAVGRKLDDLRI